MTRTAQTASPAWVPSIDLPGWTLVQTWYEGHGERVEYTYQVRRPWGFRHVLETLVVSVYRDGRPPSFDVPSRANDYLKARDIKADPERFTPIGRASTSPCATEGGQTYADNQTGTLWRLVGVAGHGEWAYQIED
jgi:hypothetical protein